MKINKTSYKLKKTNYSKIEYEKKHIILGNSFSSDMSHHDGWLLRNNGNYKNTSTYSIDKDGSIYEHYDPKFWSNFTKHEVDKNAISISLVNEGWATPIGDDYYDLRGNLLNSEPVSRTWRGYDFWVPYEEPQYKALRWLLIKLLKDFNIQPNITTHITEMRDLELPNGVITRGNVSKEFSDLSPLFDFNKIKSTN